MLRKKGEDWPDADGALGNLKNEIETEFPNRGAYISDFVSTGAKSYAYKVADVNGETIAEVVKVKGGRQTIKNAEVFTFKSLLAATREGLQLEGTQLLFTRDIHTQTNKSLNVTKKFAFSSNKRRLLPDTPTIETLPYGYIRNRSE